MRRIKVDKEKCMACFGCTFACMAEHNEDGKTVYDLDLEDKKNESRTHVAYDQDAQSVSLVCRHCDDAECVYTCMSGAMHKDPETGFVLYDKEKCVSCFMCVMACPYGGLKLDRLSKKIVLKCDMCGDLEVPRCVAFCPTKALEVVEVE